MYFHIREKLETSQIVQDNAEKHKPNRNNGMTKKEVHPGEQVLISLPTSTNKLLAQWQGPYMIERK